MALIREKFKYCEKCGKKLEDFVNEEDEPFYDHLTGEQVKGLRCVLYSEMPGMMSTYYEGHTSIEARCFQDRIDQVTDIDNVKDSKYYQVNQAIQVVF